MKGVLKSRWVWLFVLLVVIGLYQARDFVAQTAPYFYSLYVRTAMTLQSGSTFTNASTGTHSGGNTFSGATTFSGVATHSTRLNADSSVTKSSGFWAGAPYQAADPLMAFSYFNDFIGTQLDSANGVYSGTVAHKTYSGTNANVIGWKATGDAGWTLTQGTSLGGVLTVTTLTGSNNEFYMQLGELGTEAFVDFTASNGDRVWLEYRLADTDITSSAANFFVGLAEEGSAVANFIADAGNDIADKDVVGFVQWEANEDTVYALYQTSGGVPCDTFPTAITTSQTRFGIYFNGATTVTWYVNGTAIGSVATTQALFPDTENLSPLIGVKEGAQDRVLSWDYIKLISER